MFCIYKRNISVAHGSQITKLMSFINRRNFKVKTSLSKKGSR